eukprot:3360325-Karenia_brevis.AAC.1
MERVVGAMQKWQAKDGSPEKYLSIGFRKCRSGSSACGQIPMADPLAVHPVLHLHHIFVSCDPWHVPQVALSLHSDVEIVPDLQIDVLLTNMGITEAEALHYQRTSVLDFLANTFFKAKSLAECSKAICALCNA